MSSNSAASVSASEPKAMKSIPMKYLKYMCYGLYLLKRICPHPEEYAARSVELLKLHGSVEEIIHDIDYILDGPLQTEMHEIKTIRKNLNKPAKGAKKMAAALKDKPLAAAIVESAQQSTVEHVIARSDNDQSDNDQSDNEHDDVSDIIGTNAPVVKTKKLVKVAKGAANPMEAAEKAVHEAIQTVKAQREAEKAAEKAQKEAEKAQKDAEKAQKDAQKEAEKAQKEAQKAAEKAQKDAEKAQKEAEKAAEKAQKEAEKAAEKAQKEAEKAKKEAEKAAEKAKKDAEKASKVKSIKVPVAVTAELTAEQEK